MVSDRKIAKTVLIAALILSGFAFIIYHLHFLLLLFAGIFFASLFSHMSNLLKKKINLNYGLCLAIVLLSIVASFTVIFIFIGPSISDQVEKMIDTLPESLANLKSKISNTQIGKKIFEQISDEPAQIVKNNKEFLSKILWSFTGTFGALVNIFIIIVTAIYFAVNPILYTGYFKKLFPPDYRNRIDEVLKKIQLILNQWMFAKLISMSVVGVSTSIGLLILGVPLPYALALIATLCSFIPNIGPYLGLLPAVLIGFMQSPQDALYVVILYFSIQIVESYLVTPNLQKKMVSLPPAVTLFWIVLMGLVAGVLGVVFAAPILAALMVIINELYVKDYLEDKSQLK